MWWFAEVAAGSKWRFCPFLYTNTSICFFQLFCFLSLLSFLSFFCSFFFVSSFFFFLSLFFFSLFVSIFNYLIPSPKIFPPLYSSQNVPPSLYVVRPPKNSSFVPPDFSPPLLGLLSGVFIEHGKWELPYLCPIMETR